MTNILFPPAGVHPAAHAPIPAPARVTSETRVAPVASGGGAAFGSAHGGTGQPGTRGSNGKPHSAPPTILQVKINAMLQEQAEAQQRDAAQPDAATGPGARAAQDVSAQPAAPDDQSAPPSDSRDRRSVFKTLP